MMKAIWFVCLAAILISIAAFSCDNRNITEPRLCSDDDVVTWVYWSPSHDAIAFDCSISKPAYIYACIINNTGELVRSVYDEQLEAGSHTYLWDLKDNSGQVVDEGYYGFYYITDEYEGTQWVEYKK